MAQQLRPQHPALVGAAPEGGATEGAPFPGFWSRAVPENSSLADVPPAAQAPLPDSPGMVSMELTQPTLAVHAPVQHLPGDVTAGLPSLGALAEADEEEDSGAAQQQWQEQQQQQQHALGEVTAALPSLGALAEADEEEEAAAVQRQQQQRAQMPGEVTAALPSLGALAEADEMEEGEGPSQQQAAGWAQAAALVADVTVGNITAALPGLGLLVEEDEEDAAGMDLTEPAGRVLEHHPPVQPEAGADAAPAEALQQSPAPTAVLAAGQSSPALLNVAQPQQAAEQEDQQETQALAPAPTEAPAPDAQPGSAAPARTTGRRSMGRFSLGGSSADELAGVEEAARAAQLNKWGFAPGQEDTLDINLEIHGRDGGTAESTSQQGRRGAAEVGIRPLLLALPVH